MNTHHYDVLIIGGGHAGIEAAYAAAKLGSKTALVTLNKETIGLMPCNPSVGGLGKGHIVFEVSALGGLMPRLCSQTYLQARMLNTRKGPAVQGLRLQIDKYAYNKAAIAALEAAPNLTIHEGMAVEILLQVEDGVKKIIGIKTAAGEALYAHAVVVTTGTFLNGRVHIGHESHAAGRMNEAAAVGLSDSLAHAMGITLGRLKTGTPPRLLRSSINFSVLELQDSHKLEYLFEFDPVHAEEKVPCYITYTNAQTHEIIRSNLDKSAMYSGRMCKNGPRYCPSIEDKVGRFPQREGHHVFIEPEGGDNSEVYPSGLSTSLPLDVQTEYIRSIAGFENAVLVKSGYSVEYDCVQPTHLRHTLETKSVEGLFFAGQINGTTGYEEAAGQGIVAGINAHQKAAGKEAFILDRSESYIGVMIDDLVTLGADEPYRMFTSRAERRLLLRQDNVFLRLMPRGHALGLIDEATYQKFLAEKEILMRCIDYVSSASTAAQAVHALFQVIDWDDAAAARAHDALCAALGCEALNSRVLLGVHAVVKYDGYIAREEREVAKIKRYQEMQLPVDIDYRAVAGLSIELQQKLGRVRPQTIAQAQLIPGMTPAAISLLIFQTRVVLQKDV